MKNWEIFFIVIVASVIGFGVTPLNKSINDLKEKNNKLLIKKKQKVLELKEFMKESDKESGQILDPEIAIPQNLLQTELVTDIKNMGAKVGIQVPNSWNFSVKEDADLEVSEIDLSFSIKNTRGNIYKFLQLVERNPRFMGIKNFGIRSFYEGNTKKTEMEINLYAFSQEKLKD